MRPTEVVGLLAALKAGGRFHRRTGQPETCMCLAGASTLSPLGMVSPRDPPPEAPSMPLPSPLPPSGPPGPLGWTLLMHLPRPSGGRGGVGPARCGSGQRLFLTSCGPDDPAPVGPGRGHSVQQ